MKRPLARLVFLVVLLASCRPQLAAQRAPPMAPTPPVVVPSPTPGTAQVTRILTKPSPTAQPDQEATTTDPNGELPPPSLFATSWDDRSDFAAGLVPGAQGVLDELPLAAVYHIAVTIDDTLTAIDGAQEVRYTNAEAIPLEEVYFRLYPHLMGGAITVTNLQVNGTLMAPEVELADSAMRVPLPAPLEPGEQVVLTMDFAIIVPQDEGGGHYGTFILDEEILALAHFYPILAVYDDEGWNLEIPPDSGDLVYSESAFYRVQVTAPEPVTLAASGVEIARETTGGRQQVTYVAGPMRDFYLVGSERFERVSSTVGATTLHSYTFPEFRDAGQRVLDTATAALLSYAGHFGPYPFVELDLASTPTLALGVEYPGIVVNARRMYDPANQAYTPVMLESTTAHEVAHQWFYSTVGNDQLDEPWLDESLAQLATMLYFEDTYGAAGRNGFRESLLARWQRVDREEVPVGLPVAAYSGAEYGAIVYGRGPLFFEALEEEIGADAFAAFLRDLYETHRWGVATTESVRAVAESACACDLGELFSEWIYPEE
jgi:hypothetical protein